MKGDIIIDVRDVYYVVIICEECSYYWEGKWWGLGGSSLCVLFIIKWN